MILNRNVRTGSKNSCLMLTLGVCGKVRTGKIVPAAQALGLMSVRQIGSLPGLKNLTFLLSRRASSLFLLSHEDSSPPIVTSVKDDRQEFRPKA